MKYGFIGCGNMGGAVARAVCKGAGAGDVLLANRTPAKAQALAGELGCACGTNEQVASICDFIFLGVKPQMMADMLDELAPTLEARAESRPFVLVSMAAGLSMQQIRHMAGSGYPIIRGAGRRYDPVLLRRRGACPTAGMAGRHAARRAAGRSA